MGTPTRGNLPSMETGLPHWGRWLSVLKSLLQKPGDTNSVTDTMYEVKTVH